MKSRFLLAGIAVTLFFLLFSGSALGWGPYGYGPYGDSGYGGPWSPPGFGPGEPSTPSQPQGLRITRDADRDNYYVNIRLSGIEPGEVTVSVEGGRWLAVRRQDAAETSDETVSEDRHSWSRSYSYRSGGGVRRFSLPRDAQMDALQREDSPDLVKITIPRSR